MLNSLRKPVVIQNLCSTKAGYNKVRPCCLVVMLAGEKTISAGDEKIYTITDNVDELMNLIESSNVYCKHK